MRISRQILEYLKLCGVEHIYGIPAGTVSPILDSFNDIDLEIIVAKNEGGAAFMAARDASITNKLAVCIGAGGPGVNNMISGVSDAARAKAPMLIISGYINRWQIGKGAIQELDVQDILRPITKYSKTILNEDEVIKELQEAVRFAYTVPMGPVHLSIPLDIQLLDSEWSIPAISYTQPIFNNPISNNNLDLQYKEACSIIDRHENGVILVGKGARGNGKLIEKLSEHINWPILTTPEGKGVISSEYTLNYGNYGFASTDAASKYMNSKETTAILVIGSSLGENATANFSEVLTKDRESIHIDWDLRELNKVYTMDVTICEDMKVVVEHFLKNTRKKENNREAVLLNNPNVYECTGVSLKEFLEKLPNHMPKDTRYLCDMGEFMNFTFKYLTIPAEGDFETNLNYAAMGHSIGGAVGAFMTDKDRTTAVIAGDGCFFMNGNEVLTAKEYELPIVYILVNNAMLGFVEHGHKFLFKRVVEGFVQKRIDLSQLVETCGIPSLQINDIRDMDKIGELLSLSGPKVIEVITDGSEPSPNGDRLKSLANK